MNIKVQKLVSDYISRNRNTSKGWRRLVRRLLKKHLYIPAEQRFEAIFALQRAGRLSEYHQALHDAAIECARYGAPGEALKIAGLLPKEYISTHLKNVLDIIQCTRGAHFPQLVIEPITFCNLRCPGCYHGGQTADELPTLNRRMSFDEFEVIWSKVAGRVGQLALEGNGETMLHPDIYRMIEHVSPVKVFIETNGSLPLDHERLVGGNLDEFVFSIDGIDERTYGLYRLGGSFEKAANNLQTLAETKRRQGALTPKIVFKYISFKHNEMYLEQARRLAADLGADEFVNDFCTVRPPFKDMASYIRRYVPIGQAVSPQVEVYDLGDQSLHFREGYDSPYCGHASLVPMVRVNGEVAPCCRPGVPTFGNLLQQSFEEIWQSEKFRRFRRSVLEDRRQYWHCRACPLPIAWPFGQVLTNTILAPPPGPGVSNSCLRYEDLALEETWADELRIKGLASELQYFIDSGKYKDSQA